MGCKGAGMDKRILIVDDDAVSREILLDMLEECGACMSASGGPAALDMFGRALEQEKGFDLVVVDALMSAMDGFQVLSGLRALEKKSPGQGNKPARVVLTSSLTRLSGLNNFKDTGPLRAVVKPYNREMLLAAVQGS